METERRVLQVNLKNRGGAFSLIYEAGKELYPQIIFDYFCDSPFYQDERYEFLINHNSRIYDNDIKTNRLSKQYLLYKEFLHVLKNNKYSIVHINTDTAWKALIYVIGSRKAKVDKIIVHSHSSGINGHYYKINYFLHILSRRILSQKGIIKFACCRKAAEWMFKSIKDVNYIRNGINTNDYAYNAVARDKIREELNIDNDTRLIGTVGDYSFAKNPEFISKLIDSFKDNKNYSFLLVGEGNGKSELLNNTRYKKRVICVPQVTNIMDYLSAMDVFILPSRFEGLPMSALEAQASGCITLLSENISSETRCSKYCMFLRLNIKEWHEKIKTLSLNNNRNLQKTFLKLDNIDITETADQLSKIYRWKTNENKNRKI